MFVFAMLFVVFRYWDVCCVVMSTTCLNKLDNVLRHLETHRRGQRNLRGPKYEVCSFPFRRIATVESNLAWLLVTYSDLESTHFWCLK